MFNQKSADKSEKGCEEYMKLNMKLFCSVCDRGN